MNDQRKTVKLTRKGVKISWKEQGERGKEVGGGQEREVKGEEKLKRNINWQHDYEILARNIPFCTINQKRNTEYRRGSKFQQPRKKALMKTQENNGSRKMLGKLCLSQKESGILHVMSEPDRCTGDFRVLFLAKARLGGFSSRRSVTIHLTFEMLSRLERQLSDKGTCCSCKRSKLSSQHLHYDSSKDDTLFWLLCIYVLYTHTYK